jgi:hypothetical protein
MSTVSIIQEKSEQSSSRFRALSGTRQSVGRTPGEALDALNAELGESSGGSIVLVQQFGGDSYFSEEQNARLEALLAQRDNLTDLERVELESLVREEVRASAKRTEALADALGR